jgi:hypothetical protein
MPEGGPRVITADDLVERSGDVVIQGGLQRVESTTAIEEDQANGVATPTSTGLPTDSLSTETETLSLEQQALRAVLESGNENSSSSRDMTIDLQTDTLNLFDRPQGPGDETDAFRQDILTRPEESTMEDYSSVPIESFGAALLRGMGWNPGSGPNPKVHEPKRRPAGLGLGASEKPGSESGKAGQGKGSTEGMSRGERDRKRKEDYATRGGRGYIPVVKRARVSPVPKFSFSSRQGKLRPMTDSCMLYAHRKATLTDLPLLQPLELDLPDRGPASPGLDLGKGLGRSVLLVAIRPDLGGGTGIGRHTGLIRIETGIGELAEGMYDWTENIWS